MPRQPYGRIRDVKRQIAFLIVLSSIALGNEVVMPPLNEKTFVGVWEAMPMQPLPTEVVHMEINKEGDSARFNLPVRSLN